MLCAGFYEYGQPITPLELGYSVVGWQHAGFGGSSVRLTHFPRRLEAHSPIAIGALPLVAHLLMPIVSLMSVRVPHSHTMCISRAQGTPLPATERRFIEAVMQFATCAPEHGGLGFPVERIVLSGWSIGGYPAAHAASLYPRLRYLVRAPPLPIASPSASLWPTTCRSFALLFLRSFMS